MASDFAAERSPEARALAEEALLRLLLALEGQHAEVVVLVVLGGLVPEILTRGQADSVPRHLGTTDVDIHVSFVTEPDRDLSSLEAALEEAGFEPDARHGGGWRWRIRIGDVPIKVEFLCDQGDLPANEPVALPGCQRLTAANLRGTGFVARDWTEEGLSGTIDGNSATVMAKYAGLEGYLMAKAYAVRHRGLDRDYYDLVFVLLYNRAGGAAEAARLLRAGKFAADVTAARSVFREIKARFANANDFGPTSYANQALQVDPEAAHSCGRTPSPSSPSSLPNCGSTSSEPASGPDTSPPADQRASREPQIGNPLNLSRSHARGLRTAKFSGPNRVLREPIERRPNCACVSDLSGLQRA